MTFYIWDEDINQVIRGPYEHEATAAAVRWEVEYYTNTSHNLKIVTDSFVNEGSRGLTKSGF